ncbi:MAG: sigma-70 family RNA polymerase sigma factor [Gammaproteobacteria bacterium]
MHGHPLDPETSDIAPGAEAPSPVDPLKQQAAKYRGPLLRFFTRHAAADAEDMVQEVFVRVAQRRDVTTAAHFEAYLFQTASNLLRDRFRRRQTRRTDHHVSLEEIRYEGEVPSEERVYEGRETLRRFTDALADLPPTCRLVFILQRYEGMSYAAIAGRLGVTVSAVEKHMMKALLHFDMRLGPL